MDDIFKHTIQWSKNDSRASGCHTSNFEFQPLHKFT